MHVVGHDHESMRQIVPQDFSIAADRVYHHLRNHRLAQIEGSAASLLQQAIQCREDLAGGPLTRRKDPLRRQAAVKPPCKEYRPPRVPDMRKTAPRKHLYGMSVWLRAE